MKIFKGTLKLSIEKLKLNLLSLRQLPQYPRLHLPNLLRAKTRYLLLKPMIGTRKMSPLMKK
jgi:hypothetical protein